MVISKDDYLIPVFSSDGELVAMKLSPAKSLDDYTLPCLASDGELVAMKGASVKTLDDTGLPVLCSDGELVLVKGEGPMTLIASFQGVDGTIGYLHNVKLVDGSFQLIGSNFDTGQWAWGVGLVKNELVFLGSQVTSIDGGTPVNGVMRFNGASWETMGSLPGFPNGGIGGLEYSRNVIDYGGTPYAARNADGLFGDVSLLSKWESEDWVRESLGLEYGTFARVIKWDGKLVCYGDVQNLSVSPKIYGAMYKTTGGWTGINGMTNFIGCDVYEGDLIFGGSFNWVQHPYPGVAVKNLVRYNGSSWSQIGEPNSIVYNVIVYKKDLYITGYMTLVGGVTVSYIARYNGTVWDDVSGGVNNTIKKVAVVNDKLYIVGSFTSAGGDTDIKKVASWDGEKWERVTSQDMSNFSGQAIGGIPE